MRAPIQIGDVTIYPIVEQQMPVFDPLTFFPTCTKELIEENRAWLAPEALDPATGHLVLCFQSYVLRTRHHTILVDTCIGNDKERPARPAWHRKTDTAFIDGLAASGMSVDDIDYVMCTHLHVDHVGWNTKLENGRWVPTFPRARYLFSEKELAYWQAQNEKETLPHIVDSVLPIVAANRADLVASDFALNDEIRLAPTPGHTPDHFAVEIGRGRTDAVLCGDLMHSPLQVKYPDLHMRADTDPAQSAATRRRFFECHCETRALVCTAHFPQPSTGRIAREGDTFRFVAEAV